MLHLHAHAFAQRRYEKKPVEKTARSKQISLHALRGLIDSLESLIGKLTWRPHGTEWADYYAQDGYHQEAFNHKHALVSGYLEKIRPVSVWDLGANTGVFSRIASERAIKTIAFDMDPACVEQNYLQVVQQKDPYLLPLVLDLTNPSPAIGWSNEERMALKDRAPADTVLALALIHHLAISNNVPLSMIARFLGQVCKTLIIEFVPKHDVQVRRLLATRADIFPHYTREAFEHEFSKVFAIRASTPILKTDRTLYLMEAI